MEKKDTGENTCEPENQNLALSDSSFGAGNKW